MFIKDHFLLELYRKYNYEPDYILKKHKNTKLYKNKQIIKSVIKYVESWNYELYSITNYFTFDIRMLCAYDNNLSPYKKYYNQLEFISTHDDPILEKQLLTNIGKSYSCTNLHFNKILLILRDLLGNKKDIKYIDMSSGWGDRLIGSFLFGVSEYVGWDPNIKLKYGYNKIIKYFTKDYPDFFGMKGMNKANKYVKYKIHYEPFEKDHKRDLAYKNYFDISITSPPFYILEIYSDKITQSSSAYTSLTNWFDSFLIVSFLKTMSFLKPGGFLCWYIEDKPEYLFITKFLKTVKSYKICKLKNIFKFTYDDRFLIRNYYVWQKNETS